jgi:hypothetical protein
MENNINGLHWELCDWIGCWRVKMYISKIPNNLPKTAVMPKSTFANFYWTLWRGLDASLPLYSWDCDASVQNIQSWKGFWQKKATKNF